eukprot:359684-Chlamydomonas_euryale.AAC.1
MPDRGRIAVMGRRCWKGGCGGAGYCVGGADLVMRGWLCAELVIRARGGGGVCGGVCGGVVIRGVLDAVAAAADARAHALGAGYRLPEYAGAVAEVAMRGPITPARNGIRVADDSEFGKKRWLVCMDTLLRCCAGSARANLPSVCREFERKAGLALTRGGCMVRLYVLCLYGEPSIGSPPWRGRFVEDGDAIVLSGAEVSPVPVDVGMSPAIAAALAADGLALGQEALQADGVHQEGCRSGHVPCMQGSVQKRLGAHNAGRARTCRCSARGKRLCRRAPHVQAAIEAEVGGEVPGDDSDFVPESISSGGTFSDVGSLDHGAVHGDPYGIDSLLWGGVPVCAGWGSGVRVTVTAYVGPLVYMAVSFIVYMCLVWLQHVRDYVSVGDDDDDLMPIPAAVRAATPVITADMSRPRGVAGVVAQPGMDGTLVPAVNGAPMDLNEVRALCLNGTVSRVLAEAVACNTERVISGEELYALVRNPFQAVVKRTKENRVNAWRMWTTFCDANSVDICVWPPVESDYVNFLATLRPNTTAANFTTIVHRVSAVGSHLFNGPTLSQAHGRVHSRAIAMIGRHYGRHAKQVLGITMEEVLNFPKFCNHSDVQGLMKGTAFAFGVVSGGRRPRTVGSIRLKDVRFTVTSLRVNGMLCLAPQVRLRYRDEKYSDNIGPRRGGEALEGMPDYGDLGMHTISWWAYRLLVMRGAFTTVDPLRTSTLQEGHVIPIREDAMCWFLFARTCQSVFVNTVSTPPAGMSTLTGRLLVDMGMQARGYSAHRKGAVTRVLSFELIKSGGRRLDEAVEACVVRVGGWDMIKGKETVRQRYLQVVMDDLLDTIGLALCRDMPEEQIQARLVAFRGRDLPAPAQAVLACNKQPCVVQLLAYRDEAYMQVQAEVDKAALVLQAIAMTDPAIAPVDRYTYAMDLLNEAVKRHPDSQAAKAWLSLRKSQSALLHAACGRVRSVIVRAVRGFLLNSG